MRKIFLFIILFLFYFTTGCSISAYDLAVENGFNGTVEDYLESLHGQNAPDITIIDIFNSLVELGEYTEDEYTLFLKEYINNSLNDQSVVMNNSLCSVVSIKVSFGNILSSNSYAGSGVIYKLDNNGEAYIITNHHVVANPNNTTEISNNIELFIYGYEYDSYAYKAEYVGSLSSYDIAVLKVTFDINSKAKYLKSVEVSSDRVYVGENVYAIGNSLGEGLSLTSGILSVDSEEINTSYNVRVMRFDAAVNGGNSGGPLFDSNGYLIGIVDAKCIDLEVEGMCYAIPYNVAINIADKIIHNQSDINVLEIDFTCKTQSSNLIYDIEISKYYIKEVVVISNLSYSSSLYEEGARNGDQLLSVEYNGIKYGIERYFTLSDLLLRCNQSDILTINTFRTSSDEYNTYTIVL